MNCATKPQWAFYAGLKLRGQLSITVNGELSPMVNLAVIIGVAGTIVGILLASFSLGMSRSPAWAERRQFALVSITAAGYCLFDLAGVMDVPDTLVSGGIQLALAFGALHGAAWLRYLAKAERREPTRLEHWGIRGGLVIAAAGLIPGFLVTHEIYAVRVEWVGITYRTPQPTLAGMFVWVYFAIAMIIVGVGAWRRRHEGWFARFPIVCVIIMGLLAINDTLVSAGMLAMPLLLDGASVVVLLITGILHERRFAADVHRLERALERAERMAGLGRLAAGVAHEINNPIAVVRHNLERLRAGEPSSAADRRYIESALTATQRIVRIVRQLLDAGRAAGPEERTLMPFRVASVVHEALAMPFLGVAGVTVTSDVDADLAAIGDAGLSAQVIENLLTNAAHVLESRRQDAAIHVRAVRDADRVRISVIDNGPGVPESVRARMFEPFVSTKPIGKGSGLGLAVSHGLMRAQDGELFLVTSSTSGSEFALELPWCAISDVTAEVPHAPAAMAPSDLGMLIIDDDDDMREMLLDATEPFFNVIAAATLADAVRHLESGAQVDVVLCDLMMPDGGAETWLELCAERFPRIVDRTIIITGGPTTPEATALVETLKERVLYKPFSLADMRSLAVRVGSSYSIPLRSTS